MACYHTYYFPVNNKCVGIFILKSTQNLELLSSIEAKALRRSAISTHELRTKCDDEMRDDGGEKLQKMHHH